MTYRLKSVVPAHTASEAAQAEVIGATAELGGSGSTPEVSKSSRIVEITTVIAITTWESRKAVCISSSV